MFNNQQILRLNSAGHPIGWVNYEIAARLYYTDQIIYECGTTNLRLRGGYNRITQLRSYLNINSIIATRNLNKLHYPAFTPSLNNKTLFKRDANKCLYCGNTFDYKDLSRDHVLPLSVHVNPFVLFCRITCWLPAISCCFQPFMSRPGQLLASSEIFRLVKTRQKLLK